MTKHPISRRAFIRGSAGAAGATLAATPALLNSARLSARKAPTASQETNSEIESAECPAGRLQKASKEYKPLYEGPRWHLIYGSYSGAEGFALNELQKMTQRYVPYVFEVRHAGEPVDHDANLILIGTGANNPLIAELERKGTFKLPTKPEAYTSACLRSPWSAERRMVVVAGADSSGTLYGVIDFNKRLASLTSDDPRQLRQTLDNIGEFSTAESPAIENRGIWSWGYVIYDYRRFIDNMARLKLNRLLFWNDIPPLNCREIIGYAHARGVKVVLGFPWGWGIDNLNPNSSEDRRLIKDDVMCRVATFYEHLGMDAIYFQTFTETSNKEIGGRPIAVLARDWVNDIAATVLTRYPELHIEWGLHATSILENYKDLESLDPRIVIVWEDAGVIPYSYDPVTTITQSRLHDPLDSVDATIDYSKKLANFRAHSEFAMVAKGWTTLRWDSEFEHHGPFILGERAPSFIRARLHERQPRWDHVNSLWLVNYPHALRFFQEVRDCSSSRMTVVALIEDGLFEEKIQPSAALFAEMLWDPRRSGKDILGLAMNPYYARIS
jgi:hypothetical protein